MHSSRELAVRRAGATANAPDRPLLLAYSLVPDPEVRLEPASRARPWLEQMDLKFSRRCLPLMMANESGWLLLNARRFVAIWNGGHRIQDLTVTYLDASPPSFPATSHFGSGVVTWEIPYLFRTPPGYNLLVRGPANAPKDGAAPLEGLIETDWNPGTFSMNWKITRPMFPVIFGVGEPFCMIVPQKRGDLEAFLPEVRPLTSDPEAARGYAAWFHSRAQFRADLIVLPPESRADVWQSHYTRGVTRTDEPALEHQTKRRLRPFAPPSAAADSSASQSVLNRSIGDQSTGTHQSQS